MISTSTSEPVRHTPSWRTEADAPVYLLRAGSVIERASLEAELAGRHSAGRIFAIDLLQAFTSGVDKLLADDPDRGQLTDLAASQAGGEDLSADEEALLDRARAVLAEHWPPYQDLLARSARRREIAPILAAKRFLVGFENLSVDYKRGADGQTSEATLAAIDPLELLSVGNAAYGLLYPDADAAKNSKLPSTSDESPQHSPSDTPSADGKSASTSGSKTPAKHSRQKSGA